MSIEELSKELYEDLNGKITAIDYTDELIIYFQCDDWKDYDVTRKYKKRLTRTPTIISMKPKKPRQG